LGGVFRSYFIKCIKFGGFFHLLLKCEESNTSHNPVNPRPTPATIGNWIEQQIQDSVWSVREQRVSTGDWRDATEEWLLATLAATQ
jgi:hypothetical protein